MRLAADRHGSVALITGILAPVLIMVLAMAVEVTSWSVSKVELQRIADVAAWAGASRYAATSNTQTATAAAADLAEINGVAGAASRSWNATTSTMTDNLIVAQMVSGIKTTSNKAVKVTVSRSIAKTVSLIFPSSQSTVTVSAVAVAEIGSLGPQPCITALGGGVDGITTGTDVTVTGNASLTANGCSLRSNDGISQGGSSTINVSGIYAGGNISGSSICCDLHANAGQIQDPYAGNASVQNALNSLHPGTGAAVSVGSHATQSITPGTYSGWSVSGTLNLSPGLYIVNGDISGGAQSVISGTGVTIIMSGTLSTTGGSTLSLSAPMKNTTSNGLPGVLVAGNSSSTMSFLGNSTSPVTGLIYFPNANLKFGGSSSSGGSGCTEIIASTVTLVGTSNMSADCSDYGTLSFGSLPGSAAVALVQ